MITFFCVFVLSKDVTIETQVFLVILSFFYFLFSLRIFCKGAEKKKKKALRLKKLNDEEKLQIQTDGQI